MTKKAVKAEVNTFVKGLITEASPLNFPENASIAEENYELLRTGVRQRRLGMDFETDFIGRQALFSFEELKTAKIKTYVWEDAAGIPDKDILVVQFNNRLHFFNLNVTSISSAGFIQTVTFPVDELGSKVVSLTSVDGRLIVASGGYELISIEYDVATNQVLAAGYRLRVRDLWGVEFDDADNTPNYRPPQNAPISHIYNLYNQSWGIPRRFEGASVGQFSDPVSYFSSQKGVLPSNEESVWTAMSVKANAEPYEYLRPNAWDELRGITSEPAKGYFIIDLFRRGTSRTLAVEGNYALYPQMYLSTFATNADSTVGGPTVVHEFAGRVFYGGFGGEVVDGDSKSPILSSYVAFSRLVDSPNDLGECYQQGDPTSRESSDVIDTDGGLIRISGMNTLLAMQSIGSTLILIATNGIWALSGGSDYGFSATNYKVSKLSTFGCVSTESVVKVGNTILYWGQNGIFRVGLNQTGELEVVSTTDSTIQTFYSNLSSNEKANSLGIYDDVSKTVRWMYYETQQIGLTSGTKELILDTRIPAYYVYRVKNLNTTFLKSPFNVPNFRTTTENTSVLSNTDLVLVNTDEVVVSSSQRIPTFSSVRYLAITQQSASDTFFTFAAYTNGDFVDWFKENNIGIDAKAFLIAGVLTAGDSSVKKQVPYVTVHMYRTENGVDSEFVPINQSGCFMRCQWDWSNSPNSNKWSPLQQVYRYRRGYTVTDVASDYDTGFELITTKNKVRGMGKSFSLYFETELGKDCRIVGWNINVNGNATT
jgi:hypothetical protein